ncbi:Hsp20/alpha crystallin family protein [Pelagibius sp.]|uniref:Hsp20/alpha crystallin family protein n=1 Tax=Pelagibius sp. TaxID=1931238 RepID=UPI00262B974A|nr:Hsp20/alpha crystallin family protein [Pelagibius sp.]
MVEQSHTAGWWPRLYEPFQAMGQKVADWVAPRSDASTLENAYEINVELPGVNPDDVDVSIHNNNLIVRGEKRHTRQEKGRTFFFSEREYGLFQRSFRLPPDADADSIDASFSDGVLCLKIAKQSPSKPAGKKIEVRRG